MKSDAFFSDADHLRQCGNELLGIMERNLEQLLRTKRYRALQKLYGKVADPIHALEKKEILSDEETQKLNHLKRYCIRAEESYISKSAAIFRRFGQNNPHAGLSLILLSQG